MLPLGRPTAPARGPLVTPNSGLAFVQQLREFLPKMLLSPKRREINHIAVKDVETDQRRRADFVNRLLMSTTLVSGSHSLFSFFFKKAKSPRIARFLSRWDARFGIGFVHASIK
jgi:hypothetical protein